MDRFVVREPRVGTEYPQPQINQMMSFSNNAGGATHMIPPETVYFSGPYAEYPHIQRTGSANVPNVNPQMTPNSGFGSNNLGQGLSGIDQRYLASFNDGGAQYIVRGQQLQNQCVPINSGIGHEYQNRSFIGIDRSKPKNVASQSISLESPRRVEAMPKPQWQPTTTRDNKFFQKQENPPQNVNAMAIQKKPNELGLLKDETQNKIATRAEKLKALQKSGPRAFSGPVEKVLKWHKSLQDFGVLFFYEIVAKCVSVRPGEYCSKILVIRDDNGPAMQVVYYEVDFLLPELKPPCTVRVIGRMMAGTSRLQAFNVRPATGDDVATLPRRAAAAAHHVAKLCKEYAPDVSNN